MLASAIGLGPSMMATLWVYLNGVLTLTNYIIIIGIHLGLVFIREVVVLIGSSLITCKILLLMLRVILILFYHGVR